MAKLKVVILIESNSQKVTSEARTILARLNVKIIVLPPDPIFEQRFDLPLIETDDGHRYFGIEGIERFAECYANPK